MPITSGDIHRGKARAGAPIRANRRPSTSAPNETFQPEKITFEELERRLQDVDTPDIALRPYFIGDKSASRSFAPVVVTDPNRVEMDDLDRFRVESAFAMNWANNIARWRRQTRFTRRRQRGERLPVLVAEGDSWFQFPFLLQDIIDQFDRIYNVWCVSAAGDTLQNMVDSAPEYIDAIAQQQERPKVFLFSAAGNDLVGNDPDGTSIVYRVVRDFEPGRPPAWYLQTDAFAERLAFVEKAYRTLLQNVEREFGREVQSVVHGYDYALPASPDDPRRPVWADKDQWLGAPLRQRGIIDPGLQRAIVRLMIDQLNALQKRLCGGNNAGGAFSTAFHVDLRGTLPNIANWADELHPTDGGFATTAQRFMPILEGIMRGKAASTMVRGAAARTSAETFARAAEGVSPDYINDIVSKAVADAVQKALNGGREPAEAAAPSIAVVPSEASPAERQIERDTTNVVASAIPFIRTPSMTGPLFSELGKASPVDNPQNMLEGFRKLRLEVAVGREITAPAALLDILAQRRRAVARIEAEGVDYLRRKQFGPWHGTGFIVGKNLLLTNHHVLNSVEVASAAIVQFDYEVPSADILAGTSSALSKKEFRLDPARLFITSPVEGGLDFTFVWIDEAATRDFGIIPMERASFTVDRGEQAYVIHHPRGEPKKVSLDDTDVLNIEATVIHYSSDTDYGSSGAPVFDRHGRLIALHHAREERHVDLPDGGSAETVNEGIKIGAIAVDLENRVKAHAGDAEMAATALTAIKGSDSLTGYFGGLGRSVRADLGGVEAVVDAYQGTEMDVDIGFWNIEWFSNRYRDPDKLSGAARVIADLNLDIWGLSEISPEAVRALVAKLHELFGENYEYAFSEPDAPTGVQSTAVIWKRSAVRGRRVEWPSEAEPLFHLDSRDPRAREEAEHGKIFNRYPGLFHFEFDGPEGEAPFDFYLVPLHLKAMAEGSLRRRLASRILARATKLLIEDSGDGDVILGGDLNAPLASGDLDALTDGNFTAMGAQDEQAGGFTYLKSPRSPIDNIFLSKNLTKTLGTTDYFIVAKDHTVDAFVKHISDHRPVLVRLSLADKDRIEETATDRDLDALINRMIGERRDKGYAKSRRAR